MEERSGGARGRLGSKGCGAARGRDEEAQQELRALKSSLAAALDAKGQLEAELKDALAAVRGAGGGASELLDAKKEVTRLKRAITSAEAAAALQAAEREEAVARALEQGRKEGGGVGGCGDRPHGRAGEARAGRSAGFTGASAGGCRSGRTGVAAERRCRRRASAAMRLSHGRTVAWSQ